MYTNQLLKKSRNIHNHKDADAIAADVETKAMAATATIAIAKVNKIIVDAAATKHE